MGPLPVRVEQSLQSVDVNMTVGEHGHPPWVSLLAWNRDFFSDCIFKFSRPGADDLFYSFCFAVQHPFLVCFCAVTPSDMVVPLLSPLSHSHDSWRWWRYHYDLSSEFAYSDEPCFRHDFRITVLLRCMKIGDGALVSDNDWEALEVLRIMFPKHQASTP